jgi:hypothetical protein
MSKKSKRSKKELAEIKQHGMVIGWAYSRPEYVISIAQVPDESGDEAATRGRQNLQKLTVAVGTLVGKTTQCFYGKYGCAIEVADGIPVIIEKSELPTLSIEVEPMARKVLARMAAEDPDFAKDLPLALKRHEVFKKFVSTSEQFLADVGRQTARLEELADGEDLTAEEAESLMEEADEMLRKMQNAQREMEEWHPD